MHTASSLHNQGNGFSFRHLTLLSKENPSCLVLLWTEVALSSVPEASKSVMGTGMGTDRGPTPLPMPRCPRPDGTAGGGGVQHRATPQKTPIPLPTWPQSAWEEPEGPVNGTRPGPASQGLSQCSASMASKYLASMTRGSRL